MNRCREIREVDKIDVIRAEIMQEGEIGEETEDKTKGES